MSLGVLFFGVAVILLVLWDVFETIVLPRRVTRKYRLTRLFYRGTWRLWSAIVRTIFRGTRQETFLSYYGPLSLIFLLSIWAVGLIVGFALVHWAAGSSVQTPEGTTAGFGTYLYYSGTNFFTLGLGDVTPLSSRARVLTVAESGVGLGLLALVISYLPALNQSFSRRESSISLLDARAGSPPTAAEMLLRQRHDGKLEALLRHLAEWERWSAELLESHLSYPVLAYFRSQHNNQSWLAALTSILDTSALVLSGTEGTCARQAQLTFAIARHAVVDLCLIFHSTPHKLRKDRLPPAALARLRLILAEAGLQLSQGEEAEQRLAQLREMYEPYLYALSHYFRLTIPPWFLESSRRDNWQTSAWDRKTGVTSAATTGEDEDEHF